MLRSKLTGLSLYLHFVNQTVVMLAQMFLEHSAQTLGYLVTSITVHVVGRMSYAMDEDRGTYPSVCCSFFGGLTFMHLMLVYINYILYLKWQLP